VWFYLFSSNLYKINKSMDFRVSLWRAGKLTQCRSCIVIRRIKAAPTNDPRQHAANIGDTIEGLLVTGELKEAWQCLGD